MAAAASTPPPRLAPVSPPPLPSPRAQFAWFRRSPAPPPTHRGGLSPPLVAMVAVVGTAFFIVLYVRILSRPLRRLLLRRIPPLPPSPDHYNHHHHLLPSLSPYGLDDSSIKTLPLTLFSPPSSISKHQHLPTPLHRDCAVCLVDFDRGDAIRTLPLCSHSFHSDCIDTWLRSHATCPLCRAPIFLSPLRSSRIRPSFDDFLLLPPLPPVSLDPPPPEIDDEPRGFLLTRSYSFGFERTAGESSSTPWRHRTRGIWSKHWPSPFYPTSAGGRVFSFRSYRRSPFPRRRTSFLPLSESRAAPASRRTRSMTSPVGLFTAGARTGDPEALLSPERLNRR